MKTSVVPYQTLALCLRIVPRVGAIVRVTRYPVDLTMSNGQVYLSGSGFTFSGYDATTGMSPSAIDLEGVLGFAGVTRENFSSGVFDGARAYLFACNYLSPVEDEEPIVASILGKTTLTDDGYRIEEMALIDALNQSIGETYSPTCTKTFGGQEFAGCKIDLAPLTQTGTLTAVTSQFVFRDAARSEAADYFAYGTIEFLSGANAGLKPLNIRRHEADGTIETFDSSFYLPAIGDSYRIVPGCRKRLADCRDKWNNILNYGGDPAIPTASQYTAVPS